jgi:hypothetical protein
MQNNDAERSLQALFRAKDYLADPLLILRLDELEIADGPTDHPLTMQVPKCLDDLLTSDNPEQRDLLEALVLWARRSQGAMPPNDIRKLVEEIRRNYRELQARGIIRPIEDVDDDQIARLLRDVFREEGDGARLLSRMGRTIRKSITTVLQVSRDTGRAIVSYGYDLADLLRERIAQLRIPDKLDEFADGKAAFTKRFYRFRGGKGAKLVLGIAMSTAGVVTAVAVAPITGILVAAGSLVLTLVDP